MYGSPPNDERPSPQLWLLAVVLGLLAGLAYWGVLRKLGQPVDGISVTAIGLCAAIATMAVPRLRRTSPETREAARRDPAVSKAGSFGAYLDRIYFDTPTYVLAGFAIIFGLLDLVFLVAIPIALALGDPDGALLGAIVLSLLFTLLAALPARALWRRCKARLKAIQLSRL